MSSSWYSPKESFPLFFKESKKKFVFVPKTLVFMINYKSKSTHKKLILKNLNYTNSVLQYRKNEKNTFYFRSKTKFS